MAYACFIGRGSYRKDGLNLPENTVVEIDDKDVNRAKDLHNVRIVKLDPNILGVNLEETNVRIEDSKPEMTVTGGLPLDS